MNKENKLIPELRFPEFVNDGEWVENELGEVADLFKGKGIPKSDISPNGKNPCIRYGELYTDYSEIIYSVISSTNLPKGTLVLSKRNDVIIPSSGETQEDIATASCVLKENVALGGDINIIRSKMNGVFLSYYLSNAKKKDIAKIAQGNTVVHLYISQLKKLVIEYPEPKEQQKIASCLYFLDELIAAHNDKLDTLKDHKKGLMQNLFPQEGQKVPNYRFPEFENDGEWIERPLDEVAIFSKGKGVSKSDIVKDGSLPCIRYGELYTHYNETIKVIKSFTNLNANDLVLSQANDVIIPASGETQIDIATASCVLKGGIALGGDLNIIKTNINGVFLSYCLNNTKKMEIAQMAQGISVVHLYPNQLKTLNINIPRPEEQNKIASCLSAVDDLIVAQINKIEQLKQHKKGLMQGLFPKI